MPSITQPTPLDVHEVISMLSDLQDAGVPAWLDGGWGVDALLGQQTRVHKDVDVAIDARRGADARARDVLIRRGFCDYDWRPSSHGLVQERFVHRDSEGRAVDLYPVEPGMSYPSEPAVEGNLAGCRVPCLKPELQLAAHQGHDLRDVDRDDLRKLCAHLGVWTDVPYNELDVSRRRR